MTTFFAIMTSRTILLLCSLLLSTGPCESPMLRTAAVQSIHDLQQHPRTPACAAKLAADCTAEKAKGTNQCVACVAAHDKDLMAAGCTAVDKMGYCSGPPPPPPPARPSDSPCVTWCPAGCSGVCAGTKLSDYLPAIYTAWQWEGGGNKTNPSGRCLPCSGKQGDMNCGESLIACLASQRGYT
jgi:hypothetical protein|eukprot:COSAG02_NODE_32_length_50374_cov_46.674013_20_plen_183_part_00